MNDKGNDTKLREHLANERTFLAWVRTSVALIGLGFVIVKFALFLKEISLLIGEQVNPESQGFSAVIGVVIVAFGVAISPFAFYQYKKVEKQINNQNYKSTSFLSAVLTFSIVAGGILLILHLMSSTRF
jgi:putative membrane protein